MTQHVIITGASSGIGKSLAYEYARRGAHLGLLARRLDRLQEIAADIQQRYPSVKVVCEALDVAELDAVFPSLELMSQKLGGVDCVIANAGITGVNKTGAGNFDVDRQIIQVNLLGGMATVDAAARLMRANGRGRIVGISSVAAYRGIPGSAAYTASKAGFSNYLDAVRMELSGKGIQVTAIHPGFVETELTPDMHKYPFVISADKAAKAIVDGIEDGRASVVVPPLPWRVVAPLMPILPDRIFRSVF
jgi:short-subunit dehydrogenase